MKRSSPFDSLYRQRGFDPSDLPPGRMPSAVTGFDEEYRAAMSGALALDRTHRGQIRATGADRESFLQNMLTADVRSLPVLGGRHAAFLTSKGKLVSDLLVNRLEEGFLLETELSRVEPLRVALDRYVISEKVSLEPLVPLEASFSLEGPRASEIAAALSGRPRAELDSIPDLHLRLIDLAGVRVRLRARRRALTPRFDLAVSIERAGFLLERALESGAVLGGELAAETRRIESGSPRFGVDMDESHLVLEAGLDEAVSFQKGCYIGQEYVVRLAHRGHVNRKLMGLRSASSPAPEAGSPVLLEGVEVGRITSAAFSPALGCSLALAYLRREALEPGTTVLLPGSGGTRAATVVSLPFTAAAPGA